MFGEPATDNVSKEIYFEGRPYLAIESLPGQFDQRAPAAVECVKLIKPDADLQIRSARLIIFNASVGDEEMKKICSLLHQCRGIASERPVDTRCPGKSRCQTGASALNVSAK